LIDFDPPTKDIVTDDIFAEQDGHKFEEHRHEETRPTELLSSVVA
jgi:hypothetical protein